MFDGLQVNHPSYKEALYTMRPKKNIFDIFRSEYLSFLCGLLNDFSIPNLVYYLVYYLVYNYLANLN